LLVEAFKNIYYFMKIPGKDSTFYAAVAASSH